MDIKIKKVKLTRGLRAEVCYFDEDGNSITFKGDHRYHDDLHIAMAGLIPYLAELTEQREADRIDWNNLLSDENTDLLKKLEVRGITISGDETERTVTLTGYRTLMSSKVLALTAPGVDMTDTDWCRIDDFDLAIERVIYEATEYILNRKWGEIQTEIDFEAEDPFAAVQTTEEAPRIDHSDVA